MKILIHGINFTPELVGIGKYTGEMVNFLVQQGHHVTVVTAPPYYPQWQIEKGYSGGHYKKEQKANLTIIRCPLWVPKKVTTFNRIVHLLSFSLFAFPVMVRQAFYKPDVIIEIAPTAFSSLNAIVAGWISRAKTWLHIQDFELDAAIQLGVIGHRKWINKLAWSVERLIFHQFRKISSISKAMVEKLEEKDVPVEKRVFFPNWIDTDSIMPAEDSSYRDLLGYSQDDIIVLYSGSMGMKQGLEVLVDVAKELSAQPHIQFLLCGEGPEKSRLQEKVSGLNNIRFLPLQPLDKLNDLLNCADIHVLPQRKAASDLMLPSKLLGMMSSGKAIVASCIMDSELYKIVSDLGIAVQPEDGHAFAVAIEKLAYDKELRFRLGKSARNYVCATFESAVVLKAFEHELENLLE